MFDAGEGAAEGRGERLGRRAPRASHLPVPDRRPSDAVFVTGRRRHQASKIEDGVEQWSSRGRARVGCRGGRGEGQVKPSEGREKRGGDERLDRSGMFREQVVDHAALGRP